MDGRKSASAGLGGTSNWNHSDTADVLIFSLRSHLDFAKALQEEQKRKIHVDMKDCQAMAEQHKSSRLIKNI